MKRPRIISPCNADRYHGPNNRIAEFAFPDGTGGLIDFRVMADGRKRIEIYQCDDDFEIVTPRPGDTR